MIFVAERSSKIEEIFGMKFTVDDDLTSMVVYFLKPTDNGIIEYEAVGEYNLDGTREVFNEALGNYFAVFGNLERSGRVNEMKFKNFTWYERREPYEEDLFNYLDEIISKLTHSKKMLEHIDLSEFYREEAKNISSKCVIYGMDINSAIDGLKQVRDNL